MEILSEKLPSEMDFEPLGSALRLTIKRSGIVSNMQEDGSAFEGWAVCLKAKEGFERVVLQSAGLDAFSSYREVGDNEVERLHAQRFLYRLIRFKEAYTWFEIEVGDVLETWAKEFEEKEMQDMVLNYPTTNVLPSAAHTEAQMERKFVEENRTQFDAIGQQLPVGVFRGRRSSRTRLMPGQNSAIDIWTISGNRLNIYELKTESNRHMGIVSELFFYTSIMHDVMHVKARYEADAARCRYRDFPHIYRLYRLAGEKKISGTFLAPAFHSLLTDEVCRILTDNTRDIAFSKQEIEGITEPDTFIEKERATQIAYFSERGVKADGLFKGEAKKYCLAGGADNLFSREMAREVRAYFKAERIAFWGGSAIPNHMLSSQVSCLNHLFMVRGDELALQLANAITGETFERVLPLRCDKEPKYIAFEVVSNNDWLNEDTPSRGANCTSIDAVMMGQKADGRVILIPIEWKYTENYGNEDKSLESNPDKPTEPESKGRTRLGRYTALIERSKYLRSDIAGDTLAPYDNPSRYRHTIYFIEPFYQLMRQTLWAEEMLANSDIEWTGHVDDYIHVHVVPSANKALLDKNYVYTEEKGMEAAWRSRLTDAGKARYRIVDPSVIVNVLASDERFGGLANYLNERYYK